MARAGTALRERDAEIGALRAALRRAADGNGAVVVVEGGPGAGKTALLDHAAAAAAGDDLGVARARGTQVGSAIAFGLAAELLDSAERGSSRRLLAADLRVRDIASAARFRAIHGLYWALADLAERRPLAVLVDDLQWADEPSLTWLDYVARRVEELPVALIAATRPGGPGDPAVLASGTVLTPAPLSVQATAELLEDALGARTSTRFAVACHERTHGNPLLVRLVARALEDAAVEPCDANVERLAEIRPPSLRRIVDARLAGLGADERRLVEAAAILERPVPLTAVAALAGLDPPVATTAADRLSATDVLAGGRAIEFVHPLLRDAVYETVPPHRLAAMHAEAALVLARHGGPVEDAAAHLLRGAPAGRQEAVSVLMDAARRALSSGAPQAAVRWLRRALEEPPPTARRAAVILELGIAEALAGDDAGIDRLDEAADLTSEVGMRAEAARWLGFALSLRGRSREAYERIQGVLGDVPPDRDDVRLDLEAEAAAHAVLGGAGPEELAHVRSAAAHLTGRTAAERALLAVSLLARPDEPLEDLVAVSEAAFGGGRLVAEQGPERPHAHVVLDALMDADRFDLAETLLERLDAEATRRGSAVGIAAAANAWAWFAWSQGQLLRAEANARAALAAEPGTAAALGAVAFLAEALRERGELDAAEAVIQAHRLDGDLPEAPQFSITRLARGRLRAAQADLAGALADLEEIGRLDREAGRQRQFPWRSSAAAALLAAGQRDAAVALAEEELDMARRWGAPRPLGIALTALGSARDGDRGRALLREAVAVLEGSSQELELARAIVHLGQRIRIAGQRVEARDLLRRGHALATRHGAVALARIAEGELRVAGGRPRRARFDGPESLTASERRVAELALRGLSNREISATLFITRKTVEKHLGEVYRKLEIAGRAELARALSADRPYP